MRFTWTVCPSRQLVFKCNMSCILNSNVIPVWFWLRSRLPQVKNQDDFAMSENCKWNRSLCIFMAVMVWVFLKQFFLCVSTWSSNHLSCRRDTAEWRMFDLHSLWFTPVLPPDVCLSVCRFFWTLLFSHQEPLMEIFLSVVYFTVFNSAEHPIQWKPMLFLSDQSNPSSSPSHVDNVPYYWTWFLFVLRFFCGCLSSSLIDKNPKNCGEVLCKALQARTAIAPSFFLAFFCAHWTLVAYELNVSWQADSELAEGGGGSEGREGKIRGGGGHGGGGGGVGGSSLRHSFSGRGLELVFAQTQTTDQSHETAKSKIDVWGAHCRSNNNLFSLLMALHRNTVWICWISACEINPVLRFSPPHNLIGQDWI